MPDYTLTQIYFSKIFLLVFLPMLFGVAVTVVLLWVRDVMLIFLITFYDNVMFTTILTKYHVILHGNKVFIMKSYSPSKTKTTSFMSSLVTRINPFPNKPWFLRVCSTCLLKTLREKEKLLVTSNFSFSHSVFYSFEWTFCQFHHI